MKLEVLLVQFLILAFTGVLWWVARRDLASRPASPPLTPPAETADLEQLCATLETLVTRLSRRLDVVERQIAQGMEHATPVAPQYVIAPESARVPEPARMEEELARIANGLARMEEGLAQRQTEPAPRQAEPPPAAFSTPSLSIPSVPMPSVPMPSMEPVREADPAPDPRYALVSALLADGVTDPVEIARRTGLGRGEVELIISLRERRAF